MKTSTFTTRDGVALRSILQIFGLALLLLFAGTASAAIGIDQTVSKDQAASSATVATAAFSTTSVNELLLAFVCTDAPTTGTNTSVTGVTGGGLAWVLVRRTNTQLGTAEIWRAFAPSVLANAVVTAALSRSTASSITVMSFTGVDTTGTSGSGAIGATGTANSSKAAPSASLVTTRNNSLVIGVGNDWDNAITRTPGAGQTVVHQYLATFGDTYWVQRQTSATPASGTSVTINDTAPATDRYNLTIAEILAPASAVPTITATAGSGQAAAITMPFGIALQATVKDASNNPVVNTTVTFTAPASGASGTFAGGVNTATTNTSGIATAAVFTANGAVGGYAVTASASGVTTPASFSLTNTAGPAASIAATAGASQSAMIKVAFVTALQVTVKDAGNNPVNGASVTFTAPGSGASGTFSNGTATIAVATNSSGVAAAPFTANSAAGSYTVTAMAGAIGPANFLLTNNAGPAASIAATAGASQNVMIGLAFGTSLQATVTDSGGNLLNGVSVTFAAPATGASGTFSNGTATIAVPTNSSGVAAAPFTANSTAGAYTVTAKAGTIGPANFPLTNNAGPAVNLAATAGTSQSATINMAFATALQAKVTDASNNPVSGVAVTFTAPGSGASGTFSNGTTTILVNTASTGVATAPFTANGSVGGPYIVTATAAGVTATVNFNLTNNALPPATITSTGGSSQSIAINMPFTTALQVIVKDASSNPVSGVSVTFLAPATGASGTFSNGTATITVPTDPSGLATQNFTANSTAGSYTVTAKAGAIGPANFLLTNNAGTAVSVTATAGSGQGATVNAAFTAPLQATVKDAGNNPVSGVLVTFTAPGSGASGTFAGGVNTATTGVTGVATSPIFTANSTAGGYTVTAAAPGATSASFNLTNNTANPVVQSLFTTQTPALLGVSDGAGVNYELGIQLQSITAGQITAIRFWKDAKETGTHTGHVWSSTGTLLATVTFTSETASGWQQQALATPLTIAASTTYVVTVNTGNTYYVATNNGLTSQVVNGNLKSVVGNNGLYGATGKFPTSTWQGSNYFRDVVFSAAFSISGTIASGPGTTVTLASSGTAIATTTADTSGNYTFTGLLNGNYTVTPAKAAFTFNPASLPEQVNSANITGANFTAIPVPTYSISGNVASTASGSGIGTTLTLTLSGTVIATTTADTSGNYMFGGAPNGNYTVTPTKSGVTFIPANAPAQVNGASLSSVNFAVAPPAVLSLLTTPISFSATQASGIDPLLPAGVSVSNTGGGGALNFTATSDSSWLGVTPGNGSTPNSLQVSASLGTLPVGGYSGNITVTAPGAQGSPATIPVTFTVAPILGDSNLESLVQPASSGQALAVQATAAATGYVNSLAVYLDTSSAASQIFAGIYADNGGDPGVLLGQGTLGPGGASPLSAGWNNVAISTGNASAPNVPVSTGTTYWIAVLATQGGSPVYRTATAGCTSENSQETTLTALPAQWTKGATGTACPASIYGMLAPDIFGTISGIPAIAGPTTVALSGAASASTIADSSGNYSFSVLANQSYTVTPINATYGFTPVSRTVNVISSSVAGVNFTTSYSISGNAAGIAGVTVFLSGTASTSTTSDGMGNFKFTGLANGSYTVTPSDIAYIFGPLPQQGVTISGDNVTGVNFTANAAPPAYSISGKITISMIAKVGGGSTVTLTDFTSGAVLSSTTADSLGNFNLAGIPNGSYVVTPSNPSTIFAPASLNVTISGASYSAANFSTSSLFFYDDFPGTSLSPSWTIVVRHGEYAQSETECNIPQMVSVAGGAVTITTEVTPPATPPSSSLGLCGDFNVPVPPATTGTVRQPPPPVNQPWPFITGDIQWTPPLSFKYGTVEIEAKFPPSAATLWPATWLLGSNCQVTNIYTADTGYSTCAELNTPGYTEIDMTECYNNSGAWCQFHVANPSFGIGNGCDKSYSSVGPAFNVDTNYHIFDTVWTANSILQYMDGTLITTCNQALTNPMFLLIQTQTGGISGVPVPADLPAQFSIKYVKVTQP